MDSVKTILTELGIGEAAQTIYLSLLAHGEATPRLLAERTGITRPSVYDQLAVLRDHDLVVELDKDGKAVFASQSIEHIERALTEHISKLENDRARFLEVMPLLQSSAKTVTPKIRFFEGKDGLETLMKDMLWHDHLALSILWPYAEMEQVFGRAFLTWFNERRIARSLTVRSIWPSTMERQTEHLFSGHDSGVTRYYAHGIDIGSMGYIIYGSKVAFMSSPKEGFGFIVESNECAMLMRMQFDVLVLQCKKERGAKQKRKG